MKSLVKKILQGIAQASYNASVKSVNKASGKGVYQSCQPKELAKFKKND